MTMEALRQYIDLFHGCRDMLRENGASVLDALRDDACRALEATGIPRKGSENFENIDLGEILAPDYGLNLTRMGFDVNPALSFRCGVPLLSSSPFLTVNDSFARAGTDGKAAPIPEGVEVGSLRSWALRDPETVASYYGRLADLDNPVAALDTLFAQDGFYLRVKRGVKLTRPLQLVQILQSAAPIMAVRRLLVIIEDDADATLIVCDHTQNPDVRMLALQTAEVFVGERARFEYCDMEESTRLTSRLSGFWLRQERESEVRVNSMTLFNGTTRNEFFCRFAGERSTLRLYGMGIGDDDRTLSVYSRIDHNVPRCKSNELFKFTVDDDSTAAFSGHIFVAPGSMQTEAFQANRNLVGGNRARIYTKPVLEIYNDDVKCSHGAAIGQLDEMQLFYMRTRGLSEETARLMLRQAFMSDVVEAVGPSPLRDRLHILVENRYAGVGTACASCSACRNETAGQD